MSTYLIDPEASNQDNVILVKLFNDRARAVAWLLEG